MSSAPRAGTARFPNAAFMPAAAALLAALFFGVSTPLSKLLLADLNPFLLAGLLYLGAGLGLAAFQLLRGGRLLPEGRFRRGYAAGMVLCGGMLGPVLLMLAIRLAPAASVSIWLNLELVATALLGHFLFKDQLGRGGWLSVALALGAGTLLSYDGGEAGVYAGLLTAAACLCWGFDNHFTALIADLSPLQSTVLKGLAAGATNTLLGLAAGGGLPPAAAGKALAAGFVCYGLSITLYISAAQRLGAVRSQLIFSVSPLFGVLLSVLLLKEGLSPAQLASGALLLAAVWLLMAEKHSHAHSHEAVEHSHAHSHDDLHHDHSHADAPSGPHAHPHAHDGRAHAHPHYPDLHHRHRH